MQRTYGYIGADGLSADLSMLGGSQLELTQAKSPKSASTRRSQRLLLTVNVVVSGKQAAGAPFAEETVTQVVNAHGALVLLKQTVLSGDCLKLRNLRTGEEIGCKVVDVGELQGHKSAVGIEFDQPSPRFWRISFPPEDWTPRSAEAKRAPVSPPLQPQTRGIQPLAKK
jgi:hypothetical protein